MDKENCNPDLNGSSGSTRVVKYENLEQIRRLRRTLSFITTKKKKATQFCKLNKNNRRLSLNYPKKSFPIEIREPIQIVKPTMPMTNITNKFSKKQLFKSLKFRIKKGNANQSLKCLKKQAFFNLDQRLNDYIENQSNPNPLAFQNEELNNKIDLEIRILDGILKLLNAICSSNSLVSSNPTQVSGNGSTQIGSSTQSSSAATAASVATVLINNLDVSSIDDVNKCTSLGAEIAAAIMSNRYPSDASYTNSAASTSSSSSISAVSSTTLPSTINSQFDSSDSIFQILRACKCLYVSHRKIAIYLQNLQELEKKNMGKSNKKILSQLINDEERNESNEVREANFKKIIHNASKPKAPLANLNLNNENLMRKDKIDSNTEMITLASTTKIMLKDLRIPLVWKWNDYLKAIKNSENATAKFATFAIIHLGNMIYDTQLISNIDPSVTDITFNEMFIFDDVIPNDFEITIEFYSYELFSSNNNILQSARKLAKQLSDFATFKRNSNPQQLPNQQQSFSSQAQTLSNSSNNYSYSMHKFKLIAKATLTHNDLCDQVESKPLQILNDSNLDQPNGSNGGSNNGNFNIQNQTNQSTISTTTKLPLFDYYSCCLCIAPTSTYI